MSLIFLFLRILFGLMKNKPSLMVKKKCAFNVTRQLFLKLSFLKLLFCKIHNTTSRAGGEVGGVGWDTPTAGACSGLRGQALLVSSPSTTTGVQGGTPEWRRPWLRRQDHPAAEPAL